MRELEQLLVLFVAAVMLAAGARRLRAPYPVFLALGGALLAFLPVAPPSLTLPPELALALFVAPVLLDAAYDASLRDLKDNWAPLTGLVLGAVVLTTIIVAAVVRAIVPSIPWAPAIALGAVVAPPDAVAATAVMRDLRPPHRLLTILEGESLLNDASALLIYRLAVGAVAANGFSAGAVAPAFFVAVAGSLVAGPALGWLALQLFDRVQHVPTSIILQFVTTLGVWLLAEHLGLSAVLTMVCYAATVARTSPGEDSGEHAHPDLRGVGNGRVCAQHPGVHLHRPADQADSRQPRSVRARPLLPRRRRSSGHRHHRANRLAHVLQRRRALAPSPVRIPSPSADAAPDSRQRVGDFLVRHARHRVAGRGDGAAPAFPFRDLIVLTAFAVVLGTLVIQGLTLRPLLRALDLHDDDPVGREVRAARDRALAAGLATVADDGSPAATLIRQEFTAHLAQAAESRDLEHSEHGERHRDALKAAREAVLAMRAAQEIGDDAFHQIEEELDWRGNREFGWTATIRRTLVFTFPELARQARGDPPARG